jgi:hypothetical protein
MSLEHLEITPEKMEAYRGLGGMRTTQAERDVWEQKRLAKQNRAEAARPRFELFLEELKALQERFGVVLEGYCGGWDCENESVQVMARIIDVDESSLLEQRIDKDE